MAANTSYNFLVFVKNISNLENIEVISYDNLSCKYFQMEIFS